MDFDFTDEELIEWEKVKNYRIASQVFLAHIKNKRRWESPAMREDRINRMAIRNAIPLSTYLSAEHFADHQVLNSRQGHGYAAERGNHRKAVADGKRAKIVGGNNLKNGPDRWENGVNIQTKYCQTAERTVSEFFDGDKFRYLDSNGRAMVVEVPRDQHPKILKLMKKEIAKGRVPGYRDPERVRELVKRGHYTYEQAVNMSKPFYWESLKYDAQTGVVICTYAAGISAAITLVLHLWNGSEIGEALTASLRAGAEVFGVTMVSHIATQQLSRTGISEILGRPSAALTLQLPQKHRNLLAGGVQGSSVNSATSTVLKAIKGHIVSTSVTTAVLSVRDGVRLCKGEISGVQFVKNMTVTAGTASGGAAGAWGARSLAVAFGVVNPWALLAATIFGGMVGGSAGGSTAKYIVDQLADDDVVELKRIFFEQLQKVINAYLLTNKEIKEKLHPFLKNQDWNDIYYKMHASDDWHGFARDWCERVCNKLVISKRLRLI